MSYKGYNVGTIPYSFTNISRCSLIIPFISFLGVLFWLLSFFIVLVTLILYSVYARWHYRGKVIWYAIEEKLYTLWKLLFGVPKYKNIKIIQSEKSSLLDTILEENDKSFNIKGKNSITFTKEETLKNLISSPQKKKKKRKHKKYKKHR